MTCIFGFVALFCLVFLLQFYSVAVMHIPLEFAEMWNYCLELHMLRRKLPK